MAITDPTPRLAVFLVGKTAAGSRVYAGGLPEDDRLVRDSVFSDQLQPTITVQLMPHALDSDLPIAHPRFRVGCYAATEEAATTLYYETLNQLNNTTIYGVDFVMNLWHNGGPNVFIDPATNFQCADCYYAGMAQG